uniref:Uncharacterized protein n=1 Tax=Lepeophtheirus salmonis TaxID=72036 RepID=A0A0K2V5Q9_LEPSM
MLCTSCNFSFLFQGGGVVRDSQ